MLVCGFYFFCFGASVFLFLISQLLLDEMEQWNQRQQLLAAKLDEIRKKPGNLLTGQTTRRGDYEGPVAQGAIAL